MSTGPFKDVVSSESELRALVGQPSERAIKKETAVLDRFARAFIANSPFLLLGTSGVDGRCDVSPKGDGPGFVLVLDDQHLLIPDRPGNARIDGMRNILQNPHVGLIFLIPGREDTLRVNGRAVVLRDTELLDRMSVSGKLPKLAIGVEVEECFFHCPKAFKRGKLWQADQWPASDVVASFAQMLHDRTNQTCTVQELEASLEERYKTQLY
ncbi:MAG: phosphohydrolase [Candidatus Rokuibacteriota bacterium]|nr:MAG: phosphohydrolase [Candidatus Rokubacteria bacterium]